MNSNSHRLYEIRRALLLSGANGEGALSSMEMLESAFDQASSEGSAKSFAEVDLQHCLYAIANSAPLLTSALCRWVPDRPRRLLSDSLIHHADVQHLQRTELLSLDLSGAEEEACVRVAERLCIGHATPSLALAWVLALFRDFSASKLAQDQAVKLLRMFVTDYPTSSLTLVMNQTPPLAKTPLAVRLREELSQAQEHLDSLPFLQEFAMSHEHRILVSTLRRQRHRESAIKSKKQSLLESFVTVNRFKYATRTAMEVHTLEGTREVEMQMMPMSVSVELPLSHLVDPMAEVLRRHELFRVKE